MTTTPHFNSLTDHIYSYTLYLADNALILGHRNSEWTGHGPILEQDIALSNIALDLIGQARNFYHYAIQLRNDGSTEDTLAYLRDVNEFRNCLLVEQSNGDWGKTVLRQFLFSVYQYHGYQQLQTSKNKALASIAEKGLKEVTYHTRWSSEWVIRLGDGTAESHSRMQKAVNELWQFTGELFVPADFELRLVKQEINFEMELIKKSWKEKVTSILTEATLAIPDSMEESNGSLYGKEGRHTENLKQILSEMQSLQRKYPGCEW
jgi:ring-1,2-phenylacetyl-CoA epoxidase subunit PaaC